MPLREFVSTEADRLPLVVEYRAPALGLRDHHELVLRLVRAERGVQGRPQCRRLEVDRRGREAHRGAHDHARLFEKRASRVELVAKRRRAILITHRIGLEQRPDLYKTFRDKEDGCIKVFIRP